MIKHLWVVFVALLLAGCTAERNEQYYRTHPQALQDAIRNCPAKQASQISCEELAMIAADTNELAYQLQMNPQAFGRRILSLQETIAKQQAYLKVNPHKAEPKLAIEQNKVLLAQYLAIVRWLESPESSS